MILKNCLIIFSHHCHGPEYVSKICVHLQPQNAVLLGNKSFAAVTSSDVVLGLSEPQIQRLCPCKKTEHRHTGKRAVWCWRQKWEWCGQGHQGLLGATRPGRNKEGCYYLEPCGGMVLSDPWFQTSGLWLNISFVLLHGVSGHDRS